MLFLLPNQQHQSTESKEHKHINSEYIILLAVLSPDPSDYLVLYFTYLLSLAITQTKAVYEM